MFGLHLILQFRRLFYVKLFNVRECRNNSGATFECYQNSSSISEPHSPLCCLTDKFHLIKITCMAVGINLNVRESSCRVLEHWVTSVVLKLTWFAILFSDESTTMVIRCHASLASVEDDLITDICRNHQLLQPQSQSRYASVSSQVTYTDTCSPSYHSLF